MAYDDYGSSSRRNGIIHDEEDARPSLFGKLIGRHPVDTFAIATITVLGIGVIINAVAFQKGPHPAPMFAPARSDTATLLTPPAAPTSISTLTVADTANVAPSAVPQPTMESLIAAQEGAAQPITSARNDGFAPALDSNLVVSVQQELVKRGFLAGNADGAVGPKTQSAIRQYQLAARLDPNGEVTDDLLVHLKKSTIRKPMAPIASVAPMVRPAPKSRQPGEPLSIQPQRTEEHTASIAQRGVAPRAAAERPATGRGLGQLFAAVDPAPATRQPANRTMMAAERALLRSGFGPLKADGVYDEQTRAAIMRFERANNLPVTGQLSGNVIKALSRATGEPFN